jgi:hypothetical protein
VACSHDDIELARKLRVPVCELLRRITRPPPRSRPTKEYLKPLGVEMPRFVSESRATITQARIGKLVQTSVETPVMRTSL